MPVSLLMHIKINVNMNINSNAIISINIDVNVSMVLILVGRVFKKEKGNSRERTQKITREKLDHRKRDNRIGVGDQIKQKIYPSFN